MNAKPVTQITLRALEGEPLADLTTRDMVLAAAHAIAERHGVHILNAQTTVNSISLTLLGERMVAIGLAAELRRTTTNWYSHKYGVHTLWGDAPHLRDDATESDADWWKQA